MKKKTIFALTVTLFSVLIISSASYGSDSLQTVHFTHPNIIRYDSHGFFINNKPVYIFSAGFHYFRLTPELWNDRLQKIKAAGFNTVETYIPWNFQEKEPNKADFSNLEQFIKDCANHHLWVIIRPGPFINAEWDVGGWPHWLAYKEIGFRTDTPLDEKWSNYWYDEVLPIIRKHQITNGGNIILMQLENEYDFSGLPDSLRTNYIKDLYHSAKKNGITIPLITCWTSVSRDNTDNVMSQIMDADNFYPKWHFTRLGESVKLIRRTEPDVPPMITELQGGWFSSNRGKAVRYPKLYGYAQVNALTKYVISHGFDGFNYYMFYGGTNYGYSGSLGRTTSYDYTAPISEPGGLWKKYRAVKLIGDFLNITGPRYTKLPEVTNKITVNKPGINTILRGNSSEQILYVRNVADTLQRATITVDEGNMARDVALNVNLSPRSSKFYVLKDTQSGATVEDANVQLSQFTKINKTPFILAYGQKGDPVSMKMNGHLINDRVIDGDQWVSAGNTLVGLTSRSRAARSRTFNIDGQNVSIVSDSYNMSKEGSGRGSLNLNVQTRPGSDNMTVVSAQPLKRVQVNGHNERIERERKGNLVINTFRLLTPPSPFHNIDISKAKIAEDPEQSSDQGKSIDKMPDGSFASLGVNGLYDNGYYVYHGDISYPGTGELALDFYNIDWHGVYIDGKFIKGLSGSSFRNVINVAQLPQGQQNHQIKIVYENEGRIDGDAIDLQLKGLVSVHLITSQKPIIINDWKYSPHNVGPLTASPKKAQTWFDDRHWPDMRAGDWQGLYRRGLANQTSTWYRGYFTLTRKEIEKYPQAVLDLQAVYGKATVFINGKKVTYKEGRYTSFNVPLENRVHAGINTIAVYVNNGKGLGGVYRPAIVRFDNPSLKMDLTVNKGLYGHSDGWDQYRTNSNAFEKSESIDHYKANDDITWYRMTFNLPSNDSWTIPLAAKIKATGDAQIWINGHLEGRYFSKGPQKKFYLPKPWLHSGENTLVLVVRPSADYQFPSRRGRDRQVVKPSTSNQIPSVQHVSIVSYRPYVVKNNNVRMGF